MDESADLTVGGYKVPRCPLPLEQTPTIDEAPLWHSCDAGKHLYPSTSCTEETVDPKVTPVIPSTFSTLSDLLQSNQLWASNMATKKPEYFKKLSQQQAPQLLWIGCSDSRVPANQIVNLAPGEVFVHRNISNIVLHNDINCLSVLQYAVDVLKVKHIIVCGHYGCGGVIAAMSQQQFGLIDNWLRAVKDIYQANEEKLDNLPDNKSRIDLMCELNVAQSVKNVCATTIVQNAWHRLQDLSVHGWCYRINDGLIRDLDICVSNKHQMKKIYHMVEEKLNATA